MTSDLSLDFVKERADETKAQIFSKVYGNTW